jgi:hypothetical protein
VLSYVTYARQSVGGRVIGPALGPIQNEDNASFGWPLLALALGIAIGQWRRSALIRAATVTGVVFAALSLGPYISVSGHQTHFPGPFRLLQHVPLVDLSQPGRFTLVVVPALGLLLARGVQWAIDLTPKLRTAGVRAWTPLWVLVLLGALIPVLPLPVPAASRPPVPAFISSGQWRSYVPAGRTIATVPLAAYKSPEPLFWQAIEGLDFAIPRGYFLGPSGSGDSKALFGAPPRATATKLFAVSVMPGQPKPYVGGDTPLGSVEYPPNSDDASQVSAGDRAEAVADLRYWRAAVVLLGPGPDEEQLWRTTSALLGFQPKFVGGVWLWDVRKLVG